MRSSLKSIIAVAAVLLVVPSFAVAGEREMSGTATTISRDQIEKLPARDLSSFIADTNFGGSVAASYFYNTRNHDSGSTSGANTGNDEIGLPLHKDSNAFHLDELWLSANNPANTEGRGGFEFDVVTGETSYRVCHESSIHDDHDNGDAVCLISANASYLLPLPGAGIEIKAGRFATHIGSESLQSTENFNISRGLLWGLQPINHTGVTASSKYDSGVQWMIGVANTAGAVATQADNDDEKTLLLSLGFEASDSFSFQVNGLYGGNCQAGGNNCAGKSDQDKHGIVDVILNWKPTDRLSTYVNFDYMWSHDEDRAGSPKVLGVAAAGRFAMSDRCGFAVRTEYIRLTDNWHQVGSFSDNDNYKLWSATATVDHALGDHVTVKGEAVYQNGSSEGNKDNVFFDGKNNSRPDKSDQFILGAQLIYSF